MKMEKHLKIASIIVMVTALIGILIITIRFCKDAGTIISSESVEVEAEVIDTQYSNGNSLLLQSDEYKTVVLYNDKRYSIYDENTYYMCKDMLGKNVNIIITTTTYKNGIISEQVELLQ